MMSLIVWFLPAAGFEEAIVGLESRGVLRGEISLRGERARFHDEVLAPWCAGGERVALQVFVQDGGRALARHVGEHPFPRVVAPTVRNHVENGPPKIAFAHETSGLFVDVGIPVTEGE